MRVFKQDVSVDNIIRSIHKLQATVAILMEQMDEDTLEDAKIMYYSN